jgi:hypothetical protein
MIHIRFAENPPPLFQRGPLLCSKSIALRPPIKISASTFQHDLRFSTQVLGDRVVIGERKFVQKRVRAQRADACPASEDSSDSFLSLHI